MPRLLGWAHDAAQLVGMLTGAIVPIGIEGGQEVRLLQPRARTEQGRDRDSIFSYAAMERLDYHARESRMKWITGHLCGVSACCAQAL